MQLLQGFTVLTCCFPGLRTMLPNLAHAAIPQPEHQRATCFANVYRQLSVMQCRYQSHMLTAAAGLPTAHARVPGGTSVARPMPPRAFCTERL
jgi:hypothetical protein